jgi:hypothetical protein
LTVKIQDYQNTGGAYVTTSRIDDDDPRLATVHQLRAVTVELNVVAARFARLHGLHPTDLRALIQLLDASRSGVPATPGCWPVSFSSTRRR